MKKHSMHGKEKEELVKILADKEEALRAFRFNIAGSKTHNIRESRATRKTIARAKTELNRPNA